MLCSEPPPVTPLIHAASRAAACDVALLCHAAFRMEELGVDNDGGAVCFGQLLGMCDHVSLTLGER